MLDPKAEKTTKVLAKGLPAGPGGGVGQVAFTADDAEAWAKDGKQVVLVTSGAIRTGRHRLGITDQSLDLPARQATSAVGQIELMWRYREIFGQFGQPIAQVLLTQAELSDFRRYLHLRNTLTTLLNEYRVVPVLNENDSVSVEGVQIGEMDRLAAVVASKVEADLLLSLSRLTLTSDWARTLLLEQIYRGFTILRGYPYAR
jgi:glutamate 5-kinase